MIGDHFFIGISHRTNNESLRSIVYLNDRSTQRLSTGGSRRQNSLTLTIQGTFRANQDRKEMTLLPEKQKNNYREFYDSARNNDILEPKTTLMLHMATAMAVGCYP